MRKLLGLSVEKSRAQENALNLGIKQYSSSPVSIPTREEEFKLLITAKYLVEHQGQFNSLNPQEKVYRSVNGTEIKRSQDSLTITHQDKELKFNQDNATVKNTFSSSQIKHQLKARTDEMQQHIKQNRIHTHSRSISR